MVWISLSSLSKIPRIEPPRRLIGIIRIRGLVEIAEAIAETSHYKGDDFSQSKNICFRDPLTGQLCTFVKVIHYSVPVFGRRWGFWDFK